MFRRVIAAIGGQRSLEAGSNGRRWKSAGSITSLNNELQARNAIIRGRSAQFARNNAHVAAGIGALVSNIIGPGIVPSPQHPDPIQRQRLVDMWMRWTDECDIEGVGDFYDLQALMVRQMVEAGESFARMLIAKAPKQDRARNPMVPLKIQVIHASQVPTDALTTATAQNKAQIRAGVEFSADGLTRLAYHVLPMRPDDFFQVFGALWTPIRIPADEICHLFDRLEPGQVRGLSWLAPVLVMVHELDQLQDAALVRAKLGNLICAALIGAEADDAGFEGVSTQDGNVLDVTLEPGTVLPFKAGSTLEFFDPKESAHYPQMVKTHLRAMAAGMGVPYEVISGDLESVNFSSIRAGLVEFRKRLEHWQHNVVVFRLCRPVWDRFIRIGVLSGAIDASAYARDPAAFHAVDWLPPRQEWVDPKKDLEAEVGAIDAGLMSRTYALARRGVDIHRVRREIAAERKEDAAEGLSFTTQQPAPDVIQKDTTND